MKALRSLVGWAAALLAAGAVAAAPVWGLERVVRDARRCFAAVERRGRSPMPDCLAGSGWLDRLASVPWTRRSAERVREELVARWAVARYLDAAVGEVDAAELERRFEALEPAAAAVAAGTGRLRLDELGEPLAVPAPGRLAASAGDRVRLLLGAAGWHSHDVQGAAIRAALLMGEPARAVELARAYLDTPSEALRLELLALACTDKPSAARAIEEALAIERRRAEERTANFSTHFGGARVLIEACARRGDQPVPPVPGYGHAGDWDQRARILALRVENLREPCRLGAAESCAALANNVEHARELLRSGWSQRYRLELFALVLAGEQEGAAPAALDDLWRLARPLDGEPGLRERAPLSIERWLARDLDTPELSAEIWSAAAARLDERLSAVEGAPPALGARLGEVRGALRLRAAMAHALAGRPTEARAAARDADALHGPGAAEVAAAIIDVLAGDRPAARRHLAEAARPEALLLAAELALPDQDRARPLARKALDAAGDSAAAEHARWLLVALGDDLDLPAAVPLRVPRLAEGPDGARSERFAALLATWQSWLRTPPDQLSQVRYRHFHHRGGALEPLSVSAYALGRLAEPARAEAWLDAALARDEGRFTLRRYALARWRAAVWRGDANAATRWRARLDTLLGLAARPGEAALWRTVGL